MHIFKCKCKMCGGNVEYEQGASVGVCDSCGIRQTVPRLDDEKKANLYDRANHFRRNNDFDKAAAIYEQLLNEDGTDAEAYWSLVLCRYGIEYVEDPVSHKRIPTVNRAQFTSIYMDEDYKSALEHADGYQRAIYEDEAAAIDEIQKGILEISSKEEPFDVFICYKETDNNGRRTPDSVLANDLYHQLTQEGFKVFFARITLEDKLGTAYEPYIFAALNSSKVMVALGTKPEYFNAVWVKNEWSRYLALIKNGAKKMLIPAYKDMDPYDLPEEFSHLQAQDMSKLGFMQDLIRGIRKILNADEEKPTVVRETVVAAGNANIQPLLKRAFMFLEDGDFKSADEYCEKVLDIDPENAQAYLGKLMAELNVKVQEELRECEEPFDNDNNYQKVLRFGDEKLGETLSEYVSYIKERNENIRLNSVYDRATSLMYSAKSKEDYIKVAEVFETIKEFKDSAELCEKCRDSAAAIVKNQIYDKAEHERSKDVVYQIEDAIKLYKQIPGWKDADIKAEQCRLRIEELRAARKREEKRTKIFAIIFSLIVFVGIIIAVFVHFEVIPNAKLNNAMALIDSGDYDGGYAILEELGNSDIVAKNKYDRAVEYIEKGDDDSIYLAYTLLNGLNYKDSNEKKESIFSRYSKIRFGKADVGDTVYFGSYEQDNNNSNGKESIEWQVLAKEDNKILVISKYVLNSVPYNSEDEDVTWETCSLRNWLNDSFINGAFSSGEQSLIQETNVTADDNSKYGKNSGKTTNDNIFLLSVDEARKYFSSANERMCVPTKYAIAQGAYTSNECNVDGKKTCWWWLRSSGYGDYAPYVYEYGAATSSGTFVDNYNGGVRPAMWIRLG